MLSLIHNTLLGFGLAHFREHFRKASNGSGRHKRHFLDPRLDYHARFVSRNALGLVVIYNLPPDELVKFGDVASFSKRIAESGERESEGWLCRLG